jgi:undecaprenyl-diphosphatase
MSAANGLRTNADAPVLRRYALRLGAAARLLLRPRRGRGIQWTTNWRRLGIVSVIGVISFLLCMVLVDTVSTRAVLTLPRAVPWFFNQITDFGKSGTVLWPLGVVLVVLAALPQRGLTRIARLVLAAVTVRAGFLFLAVAVPGLFVAIVKRLIGRARPMVTGDINPYAFDPFNWSAAWASLPSGHATTVFSVLIAFGSLWPRARTLLWIYALAIAASRIAVMAHFPSDVLAGALVGSAGTLMVRRYFALRRLVFTIGPDGEVLTMPGPSPRWIKSVARDLLAP